MLRGVKPLNSTFFLIKLLHCGVEFDNDGTCAKVRIPSPPLSQIWLKTIAIPDR